jgi:hypothetical protein
MLKGRVDPRKEVVGKRIDAVVVVAMIWTAGVFGAFLYTAVARPNNFTGGYNASAYWVTYEDGFIRRGLIGSVATVLLGHPLDQFSAPLSAC